MDAKQEYWHSGFHFVQNYGTGLFKANVCDFCDDVTTELADISLGDVWLQPYNKDVHGTNVM